MVIRNRTLVLAQQPIGVATMSVEIPPRPIELESRREVLDSLTIVAVLQPIQPRAQLLLDRFAPVCRRAAMNGVFRPIQQGLHRLVVFFQHSGQEIEASPAYPRMGFGKLG